MKLDLTIVSGLMEFVLHSLDDILLPAANWVLELIDAQGEMEDATGIEVTTPDISSFQKNVAEPFLVDLKNNITSSFTSQDVVSAFSIFDPRKMPAPASPDLPLYGENSVGVLMKHYGVGKTAETMQNEEFTRPPLISSEVQTEWKTLRHFLLQKPEEDMRTQLKELASNDMIVTMFPNLNTLYYLLVYTCCYCLG